MRLDRETFSYICEEIRKSVEKANANFRRAFDLEMRVAITLYLLFWYMRLTDY